MITSYKTWAIVAAISIGWFAIANMPGEPTPASINVVVAQEDFDELLLAPKPATEIAVATEAAPIVKTELDNPTGKIAIVIDDLGNSNSRLDDVLTVDAPLTLSFLSYAADLPATTSRARSLGHELLIHIPMEAIGEQTYQGTHTLMTQMDEPSLRHSINWHLSRFDGYIGFNNHMGSKFTADKTSMTVLMDVANTHGLVFLDSRTTDRTVGRALAQQAGVAVIERDVFLDNVVEEDAILIQLQKAEAIAKASGKAVVVGHPHPQTIKTVKLWLAQLEGISIVPLSALIEGDEQRRTLASR